MPGERAGGHVSEALAKPHRVSGQLRMGPAQAPGRSKEATLLPGSGKETSPEGYKAKALLCLLCVPERSPFHSPVKGLRSALCWEDSHFRQRFLMSDDGPQKCPRTASSCVQILYIYCLRTKSRAFTFFSHRDLCQEVPSWSSLGLTDLRAAVSKGHG